MKKSPLKRSKIPLKVSKRLRKVSEKQAEANALWREVTTQKILTDGFCEWCGKFRTPLEGHHIIKRSQGRIDTKANCCLVCRTCHQFIHDNNVDVNRYPNLESWNRRQS